MTDHNKSAENLFKKVSRRSLLRSSAIIACLVLVLGCSKIWDVLHGGGDTTPGPDGWIGGFAQSNTAFAYPNPDLSSLPLLDNMANIDSLKRQQAALWPEFSWETQKGAADPKRCFQMFAPDISRLGYTNEGRIYSIICPQQGICSDTYGCMNVEVSVTGQRGWVDESTKLMAADMTVEGKIWFSPSGLQNQFIQELLEAFTTANLPFPSTKANAIRVSTHLPGNPNQPVFPVRSGLSKLFTSPNFTIHPQAFTTAFIDVEIGPIKSTNNHTVDEFNKLVMEFFNLASGKMLQEGNILSWNVYLATPDLVDQQEWKTHAERWRQSIDVEHDHGPGSIVRYADGTPFNAEEALIEQKISELIQWILDNL